MSKAPKKNSVQPSHANTGGSLHSQNLHLRSELKNMSAKVDRL